MTSIVLPAEIQSKILLSREPQEYVKTLKDIITSIKLHNIRYPLSLTFNSLSLTFRLVIGRDRPYKRLLFRQIITIYRNVVICGNLLPSHINKLIDVENVYNYIQKSYRERTMRYIKAFELSKLRKIN